MKWKERFFFYMQIFLFMFRLLKIIVPDHVINSQEYARRHYNYIPWELVALI